MSRLTDLMDRRLYPTYEAWWDASRFRDVLEQRLKPSDTVLDYGAGAGSGFPIKVKGKVLKIVGVDPDAAVMSNPYLDEAKILPIPSGVIPYPDATFDVVFAKDVVEHLPDPEQAFKEIHRVLRPGGLFIAKTPNRWGYVAVLSRMTPHWFHVFYNRLRGVDEHDVFPTLYKCNTRARVRSVAAAAGFSVNSIELWEGRPEYLRMNAIFYTVGFLYERIVNASRMFEGIRVVMSFVLQKPTT